MRHNLFSSIVMCSVAVLMAGSCSNKLFDKYPTDTMQMETYGKDDSEVLNVMLDGYYYMRNISGSIIMINGLATDEAYDYKRNNSNDHIVLNESSWDATLGMTSGVWSNCYSMINRANITLNRLSNVSQANKAQYEGEAQFLRAYAYFTLVRLFGDVPKTTAVIDDYRTLYSFGRDSAESIYTLIEEDLNSAIAKLPEEYAVASMDGRATKISALTMLADVQMTRGNFSGAATNLKKVIDWSNANPNKLGLESEVKDIYNSLNPNGKEIILVAQFNNGATVISNGLMTSCVPNIVPATQPAYTYPDGTPSKINISNGNSTFLMTYELWNKLRENPKDKRYTDLVYDGIYDAQSTSIANPEIKVVNVGGSDFAIFPTSLKYFDYENEPLGISRSSCDNIIYRYAGVLLMYAECLNETGNTTEAIKYIDMVRDRAGVEGTKAATQGDVRKAIEDEFLLELNFEGHRWYNLVRTKRITPIMEEHFAHRTQGLSPVIQASNNGLVVENASDTKGIPVTWKWTGKTAPVLFAIPYDQIQLTNWTQNPLY